MYNINYLTKDETIRIGNFIEEMEDMEDVKKFTADFETATWLENETWVWAWATCEIGNEENIEINNNIDSFIDYCKEQKNAVFYFHNLKFDGEFIIYWALTHGFKHVTKKEDIEANTFTTLISDLGMFYNITLYYEKGNKKVHKTTFIDSLKIINMSVDQIAKTFGLPISKLKIDYLKEREKGHILTAEEREYIKNDVLIVAKALNILFNRGLTKMTSASNALSDYKEILTKNKFSHFFPVLDKEVDEDIRKSYKGGFTYLNPIYKEKIVENINILDVNSLYPSVMYNCKLPIGEPIFFTGKYKEDKIYDLYVQMITCSFKLKKNKIPTIQIKKSIRFIGNEYLESSDGELVCLVLTNVDLKLFLEQYDVEDLEYISGWKFRSIDTLFKEYIDKWIEIKNNATITGNKGERAMAKLMLNSLYGKFATSLEVQSKIPFLGDDEIIHYKLDEAEEKEGIYIPVGAFITAYAREKTIRTSQAIKDYSINKYGIDKYCYSDTDSIHTTLSIEELKEFCEIDNVKLGAWKNEGFATKAKFIRQKCYLEEIDGKTKITCAGMPKNCYESVTWDNFKTGFTCGGKLTFKHVKGGVKLVETDFTIKEENKKLLKNKSNDKI